MTHRYTPQQEMAHPTAIAPKVARSIQELVASPYLRGHYLND
jgi:hypothetical protein